MPSFVGICTQPLTENGQPLPCPCRFCNDCPDATLACKNGLQYCVWDSQQKKNVPKPFDITRADDIRYLYIPMAYTRCDACIYNLNFKFYSSCIGEYAPFKSEITDLPF